MKSIKVFALSVVLLGIAVAGTVPPQVVDQFSLKKWNGAYYASVRFPNGQTQELKSTEDLNFAGWQVKITAAWDAIQNPPKPPEPVTLEAATKDEVAAKIKAAGWTAAELGLAK